MKVSALNRGCECRETDLLRTIRSVKSSAFDFLLAALPQILQMISQRSNREL
jgi:hypothetical protein